MSPRLKALATAGGVFALDRLTKWLVERHVSVWDSHLVIPGFFQIVHTKNRGAAFGILSESSGAWRTTFLIGLSLVVMGFIVSLLWQVLRDDSPRHAMLRWGLALVLGGAMGNVYDRLVMGGVTDFLEFFIGEHRFPAFNVADSAISIGAALLILDMWRGRKQAEAPRT